MPVSNSSFLCICSEFYETLEKLKEYQQKIRNDEYYPQLEQAWVNKYLQPIIDMMGSSTTWKLFSEIIVNGLPDTPKTCITRSNNNKKFAIFDGKHWTGQYNVDLFNSFNNYQVKDTGQFCQTYTLMWLTGNLPEYNDEEGCEEQSLDKYYFYTKKALDFIEKVILPKYDPKHHRIDEYRECIEELQAHPARCLNVVDLQKGI